jgi:hypothetical protein
MTRETYMNLQSKQLAATFDALTAAAEIQDPSDSNAGSPNASTRNWQHQAWGYTRQVGELNSAKLYVGNCLARIKLAVGKRNQDGTVDIGMDGEEPIDDFDPALADEAQKIIGTMRAKRGGQSGLMRAFGEKVFVTGECYLVPSVSAVGRVYDVLSNQELIKNGNSGKWQYFGGPGYPVEELGPDVQPIRVWRPDAQYGMIADSSVRSCMEILQELVILTRLVNAAAISRMATAGVLLIPDELDNPDDDVGPDGQISEETQPLSVDILNTGAKAIDDPASAAAFMPYILTGRADLLDKVRHIPFQGEDQEGVLKRDEAIQRLAQGLDLPVEAVRGHMDTTFANAAQISIDTFKLYIEPLVELLCEALTVCILWPTMAMTRGISPDSISDAGYPDEILQVAVTFDATQLVSRPDRVREIVEVFTHDETQGSVRYDELREALQLQGEGPTIEEQTRRIDAIRLTKIREVVPAPPSDAAQPLADADKAVQPGSSGAEKVIEDRAKQVAADAGMAVRTYEVLAARIAGAGELAVERTIDRIGARLRSKYAPAGGKTPTPHAATLDGVSNSRVSFILGPALVEPYAKPDDLLGPDCSAMAKSVYRWAVECGVPDPSDLASRSSQLVVATVRDRLYVDDSPVIDPGHWAEALGLLVAR